MSLELINIEPGIAVLEVNRPEVRNALDWQAIHDFLDAVEQAHTIASLRALIITGAGNSFIAGGDLKVLHSYTSEQDGARLSDLMTKTLDRLECLPCPTIAAINGPARGGGVEIALACDFRILSANADLGFVQINLGLTPGWGAAQRLLRLVGYSLALELLATGSVISAQKAYRYGLANRISEQGGAMQTALQLARELSSKPQPAVAAIKQILRAGVLLNPQTAAELEQSFFPPLWASEEHQRLVQAFLASKGS